MSEIEMSCIDRARLIDLPLIALGCFLCFTRHMLPVSNCQFLPCKLRKTVRLSKVQEQRGEATRVIAIAVPHCDAEYH